MNHSLVIGYGNTLRSDDGAGIWIAERLAARKIPGVDVKSVHQLSVDLLDCFIGYDRIIFVDASAKGSSLDFRVLLEEAISSVPATHHATPEGLSVLFRELYGKNPVTLVCSGPGENFEFGDELSTAGRAMSRRALEMITSFLRTPIPAPENLHS